MSPSSAPEMTQLPLRRPPRRPPPPPLQGTAKARRGLERWRSLDLASVLVPEPGLTSVVDLPIRPRCP